MRTKAFRMIISICKKAEAHGLHMCSCLQHALGGKGARLPSDLTQYRLVILEMPQLLMHEKVERKSV